MTKAFSATDAELDKELRVYFARRKVTSLRIKNLKYDTPNISVRTLPDSADALLLHDIRLDIGIDDKDAAAELASVRTLAARYPKDPFALLTLARAEATIGDHAQARSLLEGLVAAESPDRRALTALARLCLNEAPANGEEALPAEREARHLAVRANKIAPLDPEALYLYYISFRHEPDGPPKVALDALTEAFHLLPQSTVVSISFARALLREHDYAHASPVLMRIAYEPHASKATATWARAALDDIQARGTPQDAAAAPALPASAH